MALKLDTSAMLTRLSVSVWTASKLDKKITKEVADNHQTDEKQGRYTKYLLPRDGDKPYKDILAAAGQARKTFYEETLPWLDNGSRILPAANFIHLGQRMREAQSVFENLIPEFIKMFPMLKARAKATSLKSVYNEADYPMQHELQDYFTWELKYFPIPDASDFRANIRDEDVEAVRAQITQDVESTVYKAMEEPYRRLFDGVAHMASRLSEAKTCVCRNCKGKKFTSGDFKDSLVDNLLDLCDLLPRLNLTGDQMLDALVSQVKSALTEFKPDTIRENDHVRNALAARALAIQADLAGVMNQAVA